MRVDISQLNFIDLKLRQILMSLEKATGFEFTITSIYRDGDSGVHGAMPVRGTDLRVRNRKSGEELERLLNSMYTYDPERPEMKVAILHGLGPNLHLHVQSHPNTI